MENRRRGETEAKVTDSSTNSTVISVVEALETVLTLVQRLPPVTVPLHDALGMVLAEDILAPDPLPPYPASVKVSHHCFISFSISTLSVQQYIYIYILYSCS